MLSSAEFLSSSVELPQTHQTQLVTHSIGAHSAISHQSITLLHSTPHQVKAVPVQSYVRAPISKTLIDATPQVVSASVGNLIGSKLSDNSAPIVQTLTHTPAHLTYAATPIVYKMLPHIKPVRSISYSELSATPRDLSFSDR